MTDLGLAYDLWRTTPPEDPEPEVDPYWESLLAYTDEEVAA